MTLHFLTRDSTRARVRLETPGLKIPGITIYDSSLFDSWFYTSERALGNPGIKNPRDYNLWLFTFWLEISAEWACVHAELKIPGMRDTCGMPPSVPSNPTVAMALAGDDVMWFLPSAMNVNLKKFTQALVNGGSKCDSLKVVSASSSK